MEKNKKAPAINIEALLAKKDAIASQTIQNALKKLEEQKQAEQEREVLNHLSIVQANTADAVSQLRASRAHEKKLKVYLTSMAEAEQIFFTNADYDVYNKSVAVAYRELYK